MAGEAAVPDLQEEPEGLQEWGEFGDRASRNLVTVRMVDAAFANVGRLRLRGFLHDHDGRQRSAEGVQSFAKFHVSSVLGVVFVRENCLR